MSKGEVSKGEVSKGEQTRRAILGAAVARFASSGHRGASVPVIARDVGVTASAVYAYFPTKQALFEAAVDEDAAGLIADALPEMLAGTFDGDFVGVFRNLLEALPDHPLARRVLAGGEESGFDRLIVLPAEQRLNHGLARAIADGQAEGTVRADIDPRTAAIGLESIVVALVSAVLQAGGDAPDEDLTAGVVAVLEASLRPGGHPGSGPPSR